MIVGFYVVGAENALQREDVWKYPFEDEDSLKVSLSDYKTLLIVSQTSIVAISPIVNNPLLFLVVEKAEEHNLNVAEVIAVVDCESSFDPSAKNFNDNGTWDYGLWQINDVWGIPRELREDPEWATEWAMDEYIKNPKIWVCYRKLKGLSYELAIR